MSQEVKEALREFMLENVPMDEIILMYGMEVAQEVGDLLTEAYDLLNEREII